jgi:hypothetical protein
MNRLGLHSSDAVTAGLRGIVATATMFRNTLLKVVCGEWLLELTAARNERREAADNLPPAT